MKLKHDRLASLFSGHKKWWIVGGVGFFIILALVAYGFWSVKVWQAYETGYTSWHDQLQTQTESALTMGVATPQAQQSKFAALQHVEEQAAQGQAHCQEHQLFHWQRQFIEDFRSKFDRCATIVEHTAALRQDLTAVTMYLKNESKVVTALRTAADANKEVGDAEWPAVLARWQSANQSIKSLTVEKSFVPVKQLADDKTTAITVAWSALLQANTDKDKAKYEAATKVLAESYDGLGDITQSSESVIAPLIKKLEASYARTFTQPQAS
jgi:hypothetical protein